MAKKVGQWEEEEEARARRQEGVREPAMKTRCRRYRIVHMPQSTSSVETNLIDNQPLKSLELGYATGTEMLHSEMLCNCNTVKMVGNVTNPFGFSSVQIS
ncbi:hypothetical protein STEG23_031191 [Scotinomys teguina]